MPFKPTDAKRSLIQNLAKSVTELGLKSANAQNVLGDSSKNGVNPNFGFLKTGKLMACNLIWRCFLNWFQTAVSLKLDVFSNVHSDVEKSVYVLVN